LKLRIVDRACEIVYPELEWASIARTVIDASELDTRDLRSVAEWRADTDPIAPIPSLSLEFNGIIIDSSYTHSLRYAKTYQIRSVILMLKYPLS